MKKTTINDLYNYGYKIVQNEEYFKFSLDSIILADFVKIDFKDKILVDFCTGNAPLPIIMSKKINTIIGIELQKEISDLANKSIKINHINNVKIINDNIKNVLKYCKTGSIDVVTCNPPYFKYQKDSITNENPIKTIARHEKEITLEEIISLANKILKSKGKLYLVHRSERIVEIIELLNKYHFGIKKIRCCHNDLNQKSNMILIEAKKDCKNNVEISCPLITKNYEGDIK